MLVSILLDDLIVQQKRRENPDGKPHILSAADYFGRSHI
jgi:hypothetical protein